MHERLARCATLGLVALASLTFAVMLMPADAAAAQPSVSTGPATAIAQTIAVLNGSVNPAGKATTYRFEYGTTTAYGSSTAPTDAGSGTVARAVSIIVSGLTPATLYHARLVASNSDGTSNASDISFTTAAPPRPPVVATGPAAVAGTTVTLNGSVNPNARPTTYYFDYGTTTSYGSATPLATAGSGTTAQAVSAVVRGLAALTTYHARLLAYNGDGSTYGVDITFTTGPAPPPVSLPSIGSEPTCAYRSTRLSARYRAQIVLASICLANFERVSRGIAPVYGDARLGAAAQGHADDEVRRNYFSHTNPDGCSFVCRADAAGYALALGENISAGRLTAATTVQAWMDSPGHKANILGLGFQTMGAGSAVGGPYGAQWVHMFGILPPQPGAVHGLEPQFQGRADPTTPPAVPAKLRVSGARVTRGALHVLAEITRRADGRRLTVTFTARGATTRFASTVRRGRIDFDRRLSSAQRGARSGIVTLRYAGGEGVRPAEARLRAASARADLRRRTLSLAGVVLSASGNISKRARGVVRLHMEFDTATGPGEWNGRARIADGRWSLRQALPADARRGGYLSVQFTGYGPRGIGGSRSASRSRPGSPRLSGLADHARRVGPRMCLRGSARARRGRADAP